jgi:hypothetical protein
MAGDLLRAILIFEPCSLRNRSEALRRSYLLRLERHLDIPQIGFRDLE